VGAETATTGKAEQKSFRTPDETRAFERGALDLVKIGGAEIGLLTPGTSRQLSWIGTGPATTPTPDPGGVAARPVHGGQGVMHRGRRPPHPRVEGGRRLLGAIGHLHLRHERVHSCA
jgi:hypothetical protein